jgi:predicted RNase H-like HicB family nuclease
MTKYAVVFEPPAFEGDNWSSYVPDLPGCLGIGATIDECRESAIESMRLYMEDLRERDLPIPEPAVAVELVSAA